MWLDVIQYYNFYKSDLGEACRRVVMRKIHEIWPHVKGQIVAGVGYSNPYLSLFKEDARATFSFMPGPMGVMSWPKDAKNLAALIEENQWPLEDKTIDLLLVVHSFEHTANAHDFLRESWRVLSDGGRLLMIVPNRRGLWSRNVSTPFGHGHPYTGRQLYDLLENAFFTPSNPQYCLHMPPFNSFVSLQFYEALESLGQNWSKKFGGLVVLEAQKQVISLRKKSIPKWGPHVFVPKPLS